MARARKTPEPVEPLGPPPYEIPKKIRDLFKDISRVRSGNVPRLCEFAEHFIRLRGGPESVAKMLSREWDEAPPGGLVRSRIMDLLFKFWKVGGDKSIDPDSLEHLSSKDLEETLVGMITGLVKEEDFKPDV